MGGRFKTEETYVHPWPIHVDVWQKPTQYYKVVILQLKIIKKKKRNLRDNYKRGLGPTKQLSSSKCGTGKIFSNVRSGGGSRNFASE